MSDEFNAAADGQDADVDNAQGADVNDEGQDDGGQQELDPQVKAKLEKANREARNLRNRLKELEPLAKKAQELEDAQKSEVQKLNDKLTATELELTEHRVAAIRRDAAASAGLPAAMAKFITAADEDAALEQAKELATHIKPADTKPADLKQGARGTAPKTKASMDDWLRSRMA